MFFHTHYLVIISLDCTDVLSTVCWFHNQCDICYLLSSCNSSHHTGGAVLTRKHLAKGAGFVCKSVPPFILSVYTSLRRRTSLVASSSVQKAVHSQTHRRAWWVIPLRFPRSLASPQVLKNMAAEILGKSILKANLDSHLSVRSYEFVVFPCRRRGVCCYMTYSSPGFSYYRFTITGQLVFMCGPYGGQKFILQANHYFIKVEIVYRLVWPTRYLT